jgi:hypothetical protein
MILGLYVLAMMGAEGTMVVNGGAAGGGGQITKKRKQGDRDIESGETGRAWSSPQAQFGT